MSHFNGLTPAEAERLAMLAEEAGEVIQIVGKVLRHGYASTHPDGGPNNRELLEKEVWDFLAVASAMDEEDDIIACGSLTGVRLDVWRRKLRFTHHQREPV